MKHSTPIIYFDGECALCTGVVKFILKRDKHKRFRFASLQGSASRNPFLANIHKDSFVLEVDGKILQHSTAALTVFKELGGFWAILYVGILIPKYFRDAVYRIIARNRYQWFGKLESCWIPDEKWKDRFID